MFSWSYGDNCAGIATGVTPGRMRSADTWGLGEGNFLKEKERTKGNRYQQPALEVDNAAAGNPL